MPSDIDSLYLLHKIDVALYEIKARAKGLDVGQKIQAAIAALTPHHDEAKKAFDDLHAEQTDKQLEQKTLEDKIKHIDQLLYGGKVVSPKEIENYQKEIAMFKRRIDDLEMRQLEILDELPGVQKVFEKHKSDMAALRTKLKTTYDAAVIEKARLESEFKEWNGKRPAAEAKVPAGLLKQYEATKQRLGGIGMAEVFGNGKCGRCGTTLPTKTLELLKEGKTCTCEECHRILVPMSAA